MIDWSTLSDAEVSLISENMKITKVKGLGLLQSL
jgi:hypothetical protein